VLVILWFRYAFQAVVMALWLARRGRRAFVPARPGFQVLRGSLLLSTSALSFFGLQYMPVAEFTAVGLLTPVMVTVMAAWLLHERVSAWRWAAVGLGFLGALVLIRPGSGLFGWAVAFPLAMTLAYAAFQTITRKYASAEDPYTTHFYTGLVGAVVISGPLAFSATGLLPVLVAATPLQWGQLVLIGALGTLGHLLLILALGMAPASVLMPFSYAQILFATLGSALVFGHLPDGWSVLGMAIITASGAACLWLNLHESRTGPGVAPLQADALGD
jgi:drug/metabolite transporter (DMT)-like permease